MNLYQEELRDHYQNPRYKKELACPDFSSGHYNPSCGDEVFFAGTVANGSITDIGFQGRGCVISQGLSSMLAQKVIGLSVQDILAFTSEDIQQMIGMSLGPNRLRCALLPLEALQEGVRAYVTKKGA